MNGFKVPYKPISEHERLISKQAELCNQITESEYDRPISVDADKPLSHARGSSCHSYSPDVEIVLNALHLEKYIDLFKKEDISLDVFYEMDEEDFAALGVSESDIGLIISSYKERKKIERPPSDAGEDVLIISNILSHSKLLSIQVDRLVRRIHRSPLKDCFITDKVKSSSMIALVTDKCIQQTDLICKALYDKKSKTGVLPDMFEGKNLPPHIERRLNTRSKLNKKRIATFLAGIGMCSLAIFIANYVRSLQ